MHKLTNDMDIYTILKTHLHNVKSSCAGFYELVPDEGLRKFLHVFVQQKEADLQSIAENRNALSKTFLTDQVGFALIERLNEKCSASEAVQNSNSLDYLVKVIEMSELSLQLFEKLNQESSSPALRDLFFSLTEDNKRQLAMLKDRLELEKLK